jgi:hypothetical protein
MFELAILACLIGAAWYFRAPLIAKINGLLGK